MVLRMFRAQEVDERTAPGYVNLVHELAALAGLPPPRVYVIDNPQPNAFATGRSQAAPPLPLRQVFSIPCRKKNLQV